MMIKTLTCVVALMIAGQTGRSPSAQFFDGFGW